MKKEIICTVCPIGCQMTVDGDARHVNTISGYSCKRGENYGRQEFIRPMRILTTTVKTDCADTPLVSVRSSGLLPRDTMMDCMAALRALQVKAPVALYQVLAKNICGTNVDIVATSAIE